MKPNVLVMVMDTARYDDVLASAGDQRITPNLDAIADSGTIFENAFAASPWTLPSHASLFTGMYPSKHGAHAGYKRLDAQLPMLPEAFADADYETVGVSNNTWVSGEFGFERGFERFHKTWQYVQSNTDLAPVVRDYEDHGFVHALRTLTHELGRGNPLVNVTNAIYGQFFHRDEDSGARQTNRWLREWLADRAGNRPFFLFVNYLEPHLEYRPPRDHAERFLPDGVTYERAMNIPQDAWGYITNEVELDEIEFDILRALYRAEISYLDERIADLHSALQEVGEWENTITVVTGDHGENIGDHGLMDHQYCLYDTLLHVPLIMHGGPFTGGKTSDDVVQLTDLAPTLLDCAGINAPEFRSTIQGVSMHPNAEDARVHAFAEYLAPQPSMEALNRRVRSVPGSVRRYDRRLRAVRVGDWKFIRGSDGSRELYDISTDPDESINLVENQLELAECLEADLDRWLDSFTHADTDGSVKISAETEERLEDLGYLQ